MSEEYPGLKGQMDEIPESLRGYSGQGLEQAPPGSMPVLKAVQGDSAFLGKEDHPLQNAKPGHIYHTGLMEAFPVLQVVPGHITQEFVHWETKDGTDRAPIAVYSKRPAEARWKEGEGVVMPDATYIIQTMTFYVLCLFAEDRIEPAVLHFSRTALSDGRAWLARLRQKFTSSANSIPFIPPAFARNFTLVGESRTDKNRQWWAVTTTPGQKWLAGDSLEFRAAKAFAEEAQAIARMRSPQPYIALENREPSDDLPF